jgi:hypothetical protein
MLNNYMTEYISIVEFLIENNSYYKTKSDNIAIEKDYIEYLMSRNTLYREPLNKLRLWKQLNWIVAEGRRFTSKVTIESKRKHLIVFNMRSYKFLKEIQEEANHFESSNKSSVSNA